MNFIEASRELVSGKKIRLCFWGEGKYLQKTSFFNYVLLNELREEYQIQLVDVLRDDWEIYKEEPEPALCTFEEAVVALKAGKKISRDYKYADVHKIGWDNKFIFEEEDLFANDWIILDKEVIR